MLCSPPLLSFRMSPRLLLVVLVLTVVALDGGVVDGRSMKHRFSSALEAMDGDVSCVVPGVGNGVCNSGTCDGGHRYTGHCVGAANIQCCVLTPSSTTPATSPAAPAQPAAPTNGAVVPGTPPGPFPYTFPYSQDRHIVSDFSLQRIRLYDGATMVKEYKMSSGKLGIGFTPDVPASPSGKFKVIMKVGNGQPLGEIIEKLTPQGRIGKESDQLAHMQTRILVLDGQDANNKNTRSRSIYIHGTNKESLLGTRQSHGCFRMGNADVVELFDAVQTGVEYFAVPNNAWPQ